MQYITNYSSPFGKIVISADEIGLTGLWFEGQKYFPGNLAQMCEKSDLPVLAETQRWLDIYFSGAEPHFCPKLHPVGTPFQCEIWAILWEIPYGKTTTYGEIASELARRRGIARMSAQAVGGAVGRNKIAIIIPCHRVVGADGSLTGYAGGVEKKRALLELERLVGQQCIS